MFAYCTKECQAKHWKSHKIVCAHTNKKPTTNTEASKDNAKKTDAEKERKVLKKMLHKTVGCQQCFKNAGKGTKLLLCSKCQAAHYCSKECQVDHWPKHKFLCQEMVASSAEAVEDDMVNEYELLAQWKTKSALLMTMASASTLTRSQMKEQPPSFVIAMNFSFNFNLKTFLFTEKPSTVYIRDLPEGFRRTVYQQMRDDEDWRSRGTHDKDDCLHYAFSTFNKVASKEVSIKPLIFPMSAGNWDDCVHLSKQIKLKSSLFNKEWAELFDVNLMSQFQALERTADYYGFLRNAFRLLSKKPRHKTHVIVIQFEFGSGLGKVCGLKSYDAVPIEDVRSLFRRHPGFSEEGRKDAIDNALDVENSPHLLETRRTHPKNVMLPVLFVYQPTYQTIIPSFVELLSLGNESVQRCDQVAHENFLRLQSTATSLPEVFSPTLH